MSKAARCGWKYVQMVERCLSWEATAIDRCKATAEWEKILKFKGLSEPVAIIHILKPRKDCCNQM